MYLPGNKGLWANSSPRIHPALHMSMAVVCVLALSNSSGALYHSVTTCDQSDVSVYNVNQSEQLTLGVIGLRGRP